MQIEIKAWLFDIQTAITNIENFLSDRPKRFAEYKKDMRTKHAVERNIEIIGEATKISTVRYKSQMRAKLLILAIVSFTATIRLWTSIFGQSLLTICQN